MRAVFYICLFFSLHVNAQVITTIAGNGTAGYIGDGGLAVNAEFNQPRIIVFGQSGDMYVVDANNNVIRKIDTSGVISTIIGNGTAGYSGDNGPAIAAQLNSPSDIAFDKRGNIYIADGMNFVIRKVNTSGIISTIAGNGGSGYSGDGGAAILAGLGVPYGIAVDQIGNIYVSISNHYQVRKIDTFGIITTIAGNGINGFSGDGGNATLAEFGPPGFITVGNNGNIYIPDWQNHRIRMVNSSGIITTIAGNGTAGSGGDGGLAIDAELRTPNCVRQDDTGNVYISDGYVEVVRKINSTGIISTIAGNGVAGFDGDGGPAINAKFNNPNSAMIGPDNNLYIADINNNRIRKVTSNVGINNTKPQQPNVSIYPNPATNQMSISATNKIKTLVITNTVGQVVFTRSNINTEKLEVDIKDLAAGIYFLQINNTWVQKFVKQ